MQLSRRQAIPTAVAVASLGTAGSAAAARAPYGVTPDHISFEYDESVLTRYRPKLITRNLDIKPSYLYSWVVSSSEFDTDVACYWAWYSSQNTTIKPSSHFGDREPVYVVFDSESGAVREVIVDGYHYYAARYSGNAIPFVDDNERRTRWRVQKPYHFYIAAAGDEGGADVDLADMRDVYPDWITNGWEVSREAVTIPWQMRDDRDHWWPGGVDGVSLRALNWSVRLLIGASGAEEADTDRIESGV